MCNTTNVHACYVLTYEKDLCETVYFQNLFLIEYLTTYLDKKDEVHG